VEDVQDDNDMDLAAQNQNDSDEDLSCDDNDDNTNSSEDAHYPISAWEVLSETFLHRIATEGEQLTQIPRKTHN
jgi:hypothetical protein